MHSVRPHRGTLKAFASDAGVIPLLIDLDVFDRTCIVRLEGEIDIACSGELKSALMQATSAQRDVDVRLSGVNDLDITAIQLFWAAARQAQKAGNSLRIDGDIARNVQSLMTLAGFENLGSSPTSQRIERTAVDTHRENE